MSFNLSSASNSSLSSPVDNCTSSWRRILIEFAFMITKGVLLLPLSILVLYLGWRQWRQQRSFTSTSHADIFTYHMAAMELIWSLGSVLLYPSISMNLPYLKTMGYWLSSISYYGEAVFHLLTCVERYLAVVHPITYLGLRKARGVRIRNISVTCAWLQSVAWTALLSRHYFTLSAMPFLCPLVFSLVVVSFCSLSVLHVLIRPGLGDKGKDKGRVDKLKERAFFTIMAITGVLWLWFIGMLVPGAVEFSPLLSRSVICVAKASAMWSNLPSSLVLPLLYLHRAGKLGHSVVR